MELITIKSIKLPFEYLIVPGNTAVAKCLEIRLETLESITPIILGGYDDIKCFAESYEDKNQNPDSIIDNSSKFLVEEFVKTRLDDLCCYKDDDKNIELDIKIMGEWPDDYQQMEDLVAPTDIVTGRPLKEVFIGLIPTLNHYEVPGYLKFGGWNECPAPEEHIGMLKYWAKKYGAKIISLTTDIIECTVDNPPVTKEEAVNLAREQFAYYEDIVLQGTETVLALAASLINSKYWYFWWD